MNMILTNMEEILSENICGFHQYVFTMPLQLNYVSRNLCEMLGYSLEVFSGSNDFYSHLVHPADSERYFAFLQDMARKEGTESVVYRLKKAGGSYLFVKDTMTSKKNAEGIMCGSSVLSDVTDLKSENDNLQFLNETIPCGFMKYTCEKHPKVTYINQQMKEIFRFPDIKEGELDYFELYKNDIFLMIPMEERRRFSLYLNRVYSAGTPIAGEMTLLRCDGTRAHIFGWVTKCVNEQGVEEFQSVCMDVTERHHMQKSAETKRYLKALTDVYDRIFEFNIALNTVKCLYSKDSGTFRPYENIAMQIEDATEKWIMNSVEIGDRDKIRSFFRDFCQKKLYTSDAKPPQVSYSARSSDGEIKQYSGIFIKIDESVSFYCCRCIPKQKDTEALLSENVQLKEDMKELVKRFTDGIAAFEITSDGLVKPLYASENVCEFFGYTQEEWLPLMEKSTPWENFVAYSEASYEEFAELLRKGEAEFTYYDIHTEEEKRIKAICSHKEADGSVPRYVMLYPIEKAADRETKSLSDNRTVTVRTFGYFDVFVGDKPIAFRNKKSKELFALLVDRRGGFVTSEEAISFLWEDEPVTAVVMARYRKVALRLKNILEEYGIAEVIETVDGKRRIIPEKVQCDLFDYFAGKTENAQQFKGSYLSNYSWGENTLGELMSVME